MSTALDPAFAPARVLVTGSTTWSDRAAIAQLLEDFAHRRMTNGSFRVLTGMADGADEIARTWAEYNGVNLLAEPLEQGRYPGPMHNYNEEMLAVGPELVVAFKEEFDEQWNTPDCIAGTEHMCRIAAEAGVPVLLNGERWLTTTRRSCTEAQVDPDETRSHKTQWANAEVTVVLGDITTSAAEVIVNAANSSLLGGGGVDGAIHRAAGPDLLDACRAVVARQGGCNTGEAVITRAGNLSADHVVHTVGPVWTGDQSDVHDSLLARCYVESLNLAKEAGARSIAFPNISTGVYRFPLNRAARVACDAVKQWIGDNPDAIDEVEFVCFNDENFDLYAQIVAEGV